MLADTALALTLVVRLYDATTLPAPAIAAARASVERILRQADVTVAWAPCPCAERAGADELIVRITHASASSDAASLGFSYLDVNRRRGTLATVFADRVAALARVAAVDEGELLGRAMAHEIVHLLLGTADHSGRGLMRGRWTSVELAQDGASARTLWTLSRGEGRRVRQAISARLREQARAAFVLATRATPAAAVSDP